MLHIHKKIKYALTALKYMKGKKRGELTTAKEICARFSVPFDPTSRVLQIMAQHKILEAVQGAYGGYRLVGKLSAHTMYDLAGMIVGPLSVSECSRDKGHCDRLEMCVLKEAMAKLNSKVLKVFRAIKVSEML